MKDESKARLKLQRLTCSFSNFKHAKKPSKIYPWQIEKLTLYPDLSKEN